MQTFASHIITYDCVSLLKDSSAKCYCSSYYMHLVYKVAFKIFWRVSLITGLEYGVEQWIGKWNGTVNVHSYS